MASESGTRQKILDVAADLVRSGGLGALTFDAVAKRLGVSKQAVIYWFPKKEDLLAAVGVPVMRAEAQAAVSAMRAAPDAAEAVRAFVRAVAQFHFADLDRFRLIYITPQIGARQRSVLSGSLGDQIHALTSSIYDQLQARLVKGEFSSVEARRAAVAIHMAVLGLVMIVANTEAMGDPLLHDRNDLVEAMADLLASRTQPAAAERRSARLGVPRRR